MLFGEKGYARKKIFLSTLNSHVFSYVTMKKYSCVFRDNRCPPAPKSAYGGNFSHEAVTLKIRSKSPKSNTLLILYPIYIGLQIW